MVLDKPQVESLAAAVREYDFPCVVFDFNGGEECRLASMVEVETAIRSQLLASGMASIKDGLSNVLYWGYARTGYRDTRVQVQAGS